MGSGNYGKSTLINALLQEKVIETSDIPNTWKLDLFIKSDNEKVEITYNDEREIIKSLSNGKKILKDNETLYRIYEHLGFYFTEEMVDRTKADNEMRYDFIVKKKRRKFLYRTNFFSYL